MIIHKMLDMEYKEIIVFENGDAKAVAEQQSEIEEYSKVQQLLNEDDNTSMENIAMKMNMEQYQSQSSASGSTTSTSNIVAQLKSAIDFKTTPLTILNLRRAFFMFFFVLICTSIAILIVLKVSSAKFINESKSVSHMINVANSLSLYRLAFRMLLQSVNDNYITTENPRDDYAFYQTALQSGYKRIQTSHSYLLNDDFQMSEELRSLLYDQRVNMSAVDGNGLYRTFNSTYNVALQQYLIKSVEFTTGSYDYIKTSFGNFSYLSFPKNPTSLQEDTYYVHTNGYKSINDYTDLIRDKYIEESSSREKIYRNIILIIAICCIFVTLFSSALLIPILFQLDTEQYGIVRKWLMIDKEIKSVVLRNINTFNIVLNNEMFFDIDFDETKRISQMEQMNEGSGLFHSQSDLKNSRESYYDSYSIQNSYSNSVQHSSSDLHEKPNENLNEKD